MKESTHYIVRKVDQALKLDSREGDFVNINETDGLDLEISQTNS